MGLPVAWGCRWCGTAVAEARKARGAGTATAPGVGACRAGHKRPFVPGRGRAGRPGRAASGGSGLWTTAAPGTAAPRDAAAPAAGKAWAPPGLRQPHLPPALAPLLPGTRHGGGRRPSPQPPACPRRPHRPQPHPRPPTTARRPPRHPCRLHEAELPLGHPAAGWRGWRGAPLGAAAGSGSHHPCPPSSPADGGRGAPATWWPWWGRGLPADEDGGALHPATLRWVSAAGLGWAGGKAPRGPSAVPWGSAWGRARGVTWGRTGASSPGSDFPFAHNRECGWVKAGGR